jgi:hypothetical protein
VEYPSQINLRAGLTPPIRGCHNPAMIRIGLLVALCMLAVLLAAGGRPARAHHAASITTPQPQNVSLRFLASQAE